MTRSRTSEGRVRNGCVTGGSCGRQLDCAGDGSAKKDAGSPRAGVDTLTRWLAPPMALPMDAGSPRAGVETLITLLQPSASVLPPAAEQTLEFHFKHTSRFCTVF